MDTILITIQHADKDVWDITITNTINNKIVSCVESMAFKIGNIIALEEQIPENAAIYIKSTLSNY